MDTNMWTEFQAHRAREITKAFREFQERWRGIFDHEQLRWNAAQHHYQADAWGLKPDAERRASMEQAIRDMGTATDTRLPYEAYSGYGSYMSGPHPALRGVVRDASFATELAESSRRTLEQRLAEVEAWQAQHTPQAYQYWNAREEARQIREALSDPVRREAYVQMVVRDAVQTGSEEGYPLLAREVQALEARLRHEEGVGPSSSHEVSPAPAQTPAERADRLAALLEEAQRQGLVMTGEHSQTHKQGQRY